jgi:hypothetical protein
MSKVYRITPLEKKSIYAYYEMFRENADGTTSWFNIAETFRWGTGFIPVDMDCNLPYDDDDTAYCDPNAGWDAELEDSISCLFEFSEEISELERQQIEESYYEGGESWLYDGDHDWQEEDSSIVVLGPFKVDLCDSDGTLIEEDIKLSPRPDPNTAWPFSQQFPKTDILNMNTPKKMTVVFAPGCFDNFEGTQEELDEMMAEIQRLADSGELFEQAEPFDIDSLTDEELREYAEDIGKADKRKLQ